MPLAPRRDLAQCLGDLIFGGGAVVVILQPCPESLGSTEELRQAQPGIGGDGTLAGHDLADAPLRHADFPGQPVLGDAHRLEEFFQQDFAGCGVRDAALGNDVRCPWVRPFYAGRTSQ